MIQNLINHISLIVDRSGSMLGHPVVEVFDKELEYLKQRSIELSQETRISIYLFDDNIECLTFDMDVMRFKTLRGYYKLGGRTSLIDAVLKSTQDHLRLPSLYGDHAYLQYVLTDGQENESKNRPEYLEKTLKELPQNWTTVILVPSATCKFEAKKFGFDEDSISIWDTTKKNALEGVGKQFSSVMDNYMHLRSTGVKGTRSLFKLDTTQVTESSLKELPTSVYQIFPVFHDATIRDFVEQCTNEKYVIGSTYYQPTETVEIQNYKNILIQRIKDGVVFEGENLRQLLGLPNQTVRVNPGQHKDWRIFVQSTSTNRKLKESTFCLVLRLSAAAR